LAVGACKKGAAPAGHGEATTHAATIVDPLASVKAKLPASGPAALPVELARIQQPRKTATLVFVKPVGWTSTNPDYSAAVARPGSGIGNQNRVDVDSTCEGLCAPKDWRAVIDKKAKERVAEGPDTRDEMLPGNRRVRWGIDKNGASVFAAWYEEGASKMNTCSVWIEDPALYAALDAFVEICKTAKVED
jgi:hypothetical protein